MERLLDVVFEKIIQLFIHNLLSSRMVRSSGATDNSGDLKEAVIFCLVKVRPCARVTCMNIVSI